MVARYTFRGRWTTQWRRGPEECAQRDAGLMSLGNLDIQEASHTEGKYAAWFERLNASVVLIRPDFQVFGGVVDPSTTDGLVHNLVERVRAHSSPGMSTARRPETSAAKD